MSTEYLLFGYVHNPRFITETLPRSLNITPDITQDFGPGGQFFLHGGYGSLAEDETTIAVKLGFVRTPDRLPLSTAAMLERGIITADDIDVSRFRGNGQLFGFSKQTPTFTTYMSMISVPQLYYITLPEGGLLACSNQQVLLALLPDLGLDIAFDEETTLAHMLFRVIPGEATHFKHIYQNVPGQQLHWHEGNLTRQQRQTLDFEQSQTFNQIDDPAIDLLHQHLSDILAAYQADPDRAAGAFANQLSGGVDSSIIQMILNQQAPEQSLPTYTYAVDAPSFQYEIQYAREASELFNTRHTFIDIELDTFPNLLIETITTLGRPIMSDADVCKLGLAKGVSKAETPQFYYVGQAADAVYGVAVARKVALLQLLADIPGASYGLKALASVVGLRSQSVAEGLRQVALALPEMDDPHSFRTPINMVSIFSDMGVARQSFGDRTVLAAIIRRRDYTARYHRSRHMLEEIHIIDLLTEGYQSAINGSELFLAQGKEQIYPFLDEDVLRLAFAINAQARYLAPGRFSFIQRQSTKPMLKRLLAQQANSDVINRRKGSSVFTSDVLKMMRRGTLRPLVEEIERPDFMTADAFAQLKQKPTLFLWNLLTLDLFKKHVLRQKMLA